MLVYNVVKNVPIFSGNIQKNLLKFQNVYVYYTMNED